MIFDRYNEYNVSMENILYFYQDNKIQNDLLAPRVKEYLLPGLRVVRCGLSGQAVELLDRDIPVETVSDRGRIRRIVDWIAGRIFGRLVSRWQAKRRVQLAQVQKRALTEKIVSYWGEDYNTACVCRPAITCFAKWEFTDYMNMTFVSLVIKQACLPYYLVLGTCNELREMLLLRVRRIKQLSVWVIKKDYEDRLENLIDELYEEYGLAVKLQIIDRDDYRHLNVTTALTCNILDCTGEENIRVSGVSKGCRWFDLGNSGDKYRKIENTCRDVIYYSVVDMFENPEKYI